MPRIIPRIAIDIALVLLVFVAPWWLVMILAAGACFYFEWYFEVVLIGFIIDSLYNAPIRDTGYFQFFAAFLGLIVVVIAFEVRERTRFKSR